MGAVPTISTIITYGGEIRSTIRDLKYFKEANVIIFALENQVELGILKSKIE